MVGYTFGNILSYIQNQRLINQMNDIEFIIWLLWQCIQWNLQMVFVCFGLILWMCACKLVCELYMCVWSPCAKYQSIERKRCMIKGIVSVCDFIITLFNKDIKTLVGVVLHEVHFNDSDIYIVHTDLHYILFSVSSFCFSARGHLCSITCSAHRFGRFSIFIRLLIWA